MLSELCSDQVCLFVKLRLVSVLFLAVLVLPYLKFLDHKEGATLMDSFCQKIKPTLEQSQVEIPFEEFLRVLSRNPYSGVWQNSIKQSKLLKEQNGTIEVRAEQKAVENEKNVYTIKIKIFDGRYRDDGDLEIELNSSSVRTEQQYVANQVIYETTSPMIGLYRNERIFMSSKQKPLFINKLKFRLNLDETLKLELLFAAEYQINVITDSLEPTWETLQEIIFALLICCQVLAQAYGSYCLLLEAQEQDLIAHSISPTFLKLGISFDTAQLLVLCYLIYYEKMTLVAVPAYFLLLLVIFLEPYLYSKVVETTKPNIHRNYGRPEFERIEREVLGQNPNLNQNQAEQNSLLGNQNLKSLVSSLERNQNYLMCMCSYLIFYVNNMQNYIYIVFFLIFLLPQITRNCRIANKINYSIENILAFAYPRLIPIIYLRVMGLGSRFIFEPHYLFCLVCLVLAIASSFVLFIQKKHGARSILPKFLIPKGMKTKFKFFAIQDENIVCIVCRSELSQIPAELKDKPQTTVQMKQEIVYNKVVLTPCHHRFHAHCLQKWMESRTQCPSCHHSLPPSDSH